MSCISLFKLRRKGGAAQKAAPGSPIAGASSPVKPAHGSSVSTPAEAKSGPGPPNHRTSSDVKDGAGDDTSKQGPSPTREPAAGGPPPLDKVDETPGPKATGHADLKEGRNSTPVPSDDISSVKPAPTQDSPPSVAPVWTPEEHAESLWAAAYDSFKEREPDLVRQYELDVYACICTDDRRDFRLGRLARVILSRPDDADVPLPEKGHLMSSFVEAYLYECEQDGRAGAAEEDDLDSADLDPEGPDENRLRGLWDEMRAVMRKSQYAAIPWVASCIALESLVHSGPLPDGPKAQATTLIAKMAWCIELSKLFFQQDLQHHPGQSDWDSPAGALLGLYRAILSYQIRTASWVFGSRYLIEAPIRPADLQRREREVRIQGRRLEAFGAFDLGLRLEEELGLSLNLQRKATRSFDGDSERSYSSGPATTSSDSGSGPLSVSSSGDRGLPSDGEAGYPETNIEEVNSEMDRVRELLEGLDVAEQTIPRVAMDEDTAPALLYRETRTKPQFKEFVAVDAEPGNSVLWLEGSPGTGKTQLLQAAIKGLPKEGQGEGTSGSAWSDRVAYFFCDSSIPKRDSAVAVVKGLIHRVLHDQPSLCSYLEDMINGTKRRRFEDSSDFYPMATVLYSLLSDKDFQPTYFVVDAIEELVPDKHAYPAGSPGSVGGSEPRDVLDSRGLDDLLDLISTTAEVSSKVRWLVSVDRDRCERLLPVTKDAKRLTVSPNLDAAGKYVSWRLDDLADKAHYWRKLRPRLEAKIHASESANFLWLKMALDIMGACRTPWDSPEILDKLLESSRDVDSLYRQRMPDVAKLDERHAAYCTNILSAAAVAYRPLLATELKSIIELPEEVDLGILIAEFLPSFLELYDDNESGDERVRFSHIAARDFVRREGARETYGAHLYMVENCLRVFLSSGRSPEGAGGSSADDTGHGESRRNDYATVFWLRHLLDLEDHGSLAVRSQAEDVLESHWPRWLEILDSRGRLSEARVMIDKMDIALTTKSVGPKTRIHQAIADIGEFIRVHQLWMSDDAGPARDPDDERVSLKHSLPYWRKASPDWLDRAPTYEESGGVSDGCRLVLNHGDWARACSFSHDGRLIVTASDDAQVRLWDAETGKLQSVLGGFDGYVCSVAVSRSGPKGRALLAASGSTVIKIWDLTTGTWVKTLDELEVETTEKNAGGDKEGEAKNGEEMVNGGDGGGEDERASSRSSTGRPNLTVEGVAVTADGDRLAAATENGVVVWDIPGFKQTVLRDHEDNGEIRTEPPRRVSFSPDGCRLAVSAGWEVTIWDAKNWEVLRRLPERRPRQSEGVPEEEKTGGEGSNGEEPSDDRSNGGLTKEEDLNEGEPGVEESGGEERSIDFEPEEGRPEKEPGHTADIDGLAFSPDSRFVASGSDDKTARIWDVETGELKAVLCYHGRHVNGVAFSDDGSRLATASTDSTVGIWRRNADGSWGNGEVRTQPDRVLRGHTALAWSAAFAPGGGLLVTTSGDRDARVWDMEVVEDAAQQPGGRLNGDILSAATGDGGLGSRQAVRLLEISPRGEAIASTTGDGKIDLWDGVTGGLRHTIESGHDSSITALVFSRDGTRLISTSKDRTARVWDVANGGDSAGENLLLKGHDDWVRGAAVSPNGRLVATASDDRTVRVWDVGAARPARTGSSEEEDIGVPSRVFSDGHTDYVYGVAFSPDGSRLASVGDDRHVLIWDLAGKEDKTKPDENMSDPGVSFYLRGVVFSAGGSSLLTVDTNGQVAVWNSGRPGGKQCVHVGGVAGDPFTMRIDESHPDVLLTGAGAWPFDVSEAALERLVSGLDEELPRRGARPAWAPLSVDWRPGWISWDDRKLIYLPPGFRPLHTGFSCQLVQGLSAVVGCESGQVLLFRLSEKVRPDDEEHGWWAERSGL